MLFGKAMRIIRAREGVSQTWLQDATGIPQTRISQAEDGRINLKSEERVLVRRALSWPFTADCVLDKLDSMRLRGDDELPDAVHVNAD